MQLGVTYVDKGRDILQVAENKRTKRDTISVVCSRAYQVYSICSGCNFTRAERTYALWTSERPRRDALSNIRRSVLVRQFLFGAQHFKMMLYLALNAKELLIVRLSVPQAVRLMFV